MPEMPVDPREVPVETPETLYYPNGKPVLKHFESESQQYSRMVSWGEAWYAAAQNAQAEIIRLRQAGDELYSSFKVTECERDEALAALRKLEPRHHCQRYPASTFQTCVICKGDSHDPTLGGSGTAGHIVHKEGCPFALLNLDAEIKRRGGGDE